MNLLELDALIKPYKIYAEVLEQGAIDQFKSYLEKDWVVQGALMPDAHTGYGLAIGGVVACKDVVSPQAVGYDGGCGMLAIPTSFNVDDIRAFSKDIFEGIYSAIPTGFNHNAEPTVCTSLNGLDRTGVIDTLITGGAFKQLGSLGSGNHFIEIGVDEEGTSWIVLHSGSRKVGHSVAEHYMKIAANSDRPLEGCYGIDANSKDGKDYITDLKFCLEFALANRKEMAHRIEQVIAKYAKGEADFSKLINRNHNHAELKDGLWIHRKGATHAEKDMMGVIPGNMRDGSFIVKGKGNPESLFSSSHGAGRVMGRNQARKNLSMETFKAEMKANGIQAKVTEGTLDESAGAYKDVFEVMALQSDLVEVLHHIKPLINIKS